MLQAPNPSRHIPFSAALLGAPARKLFASRDLHETRSMVARVMKPHELKPAGGGQRMEARMHHAALGEVSLSRLCHGCEVDIDPGALQDFYLVMMPLAGQAQLVCGPHSVETHSLQGAVVSPQHALKMHWSADCDQLMVRISRPFLERVLTAQRGQPLDEALEFKPVFDWRGSVAWQCVLRFLVDCAEAGIAPEHNQLLLAQLQELVAATLLAEQPHNLGQALLPRRTAVLPRHVRRVQEYLRAHAHEPMQATRLAEVAGCSLRGLYAGFQEFCGMSPMQYLRELRLDGVRADLLVGGTAVSVSGVALRWGFGHLGRFSAEYKARFGEHPSETLRRA